MLKTTHLFTFLLFCFAVSLHAQRQIKGSVSDVAGIAVAGANIVAKGTATAASSDERGVFQLSVPNNTTALVVSFIGYGTQEITLVKGSNDLIIVLKEGQNVLTDVVVTALGISRSEKSLGYAVQTVKGDDLTKSRDANVVSSLAGRVAGVQITGGSGTLGGSSQILIRGMRSINGENQPLFVVDGIPMDNSNFTTNNQAAGGPGYDYGNAIQDLNPNDIETISVLKGQSATALYGSRGANGVVLVTLKKGGKQKNRIGVSLNTSVTYDQILLMPDYQNSYGGGVDLVPLGRSDGKGKYQLPIVQLGDAGDTIGVFNSFDLTPIYGVDESWGIKYGTLTNTHFKYLSEQVYENGKPKLLFPKGFGKDDALYARSWNSFDASDVTHHLQSELWAPAPNNARDFFDTGRTASTNIAFEGGSEKANFRLSLTNFDQKGIFPNSRLQRNTASFIANTKLTDRLSASAVANFNTNNTKGRSGAGYASNNIFQNFNQWYHRQLNINGLKSYKNPDGSQRTWNRRGVDDPAPQYWDNPYWTRYENYQTDRRNRTYGSVGLSYKIIEGLTVTGRLITDSYNDRREERIAKGGYDQSKYTLSLYEVKENNRDLVLNYTKNISNALSLTAFVGGNQMEKRSSINRQSTRDGLNVANFYNLKNSVGNINILEDNNFVKKK